MSAMDMMMLCAVMYLAAAEHGTDMDGNPFASSHKLDHVREFIRLAGEPALWHMMASVLPAKTTLEAAFGSLTSPVIDFSDVFRQPKPNAN